MNINSAQWWYLGSYPYKGLIGNRKYGRAVRLADLMKKGLRRIPGSGLLDGGMLDLQT